VFVSLLLHPGGVKCSSIALGHNNEGNHGTVMREEGEQAVKRLWLP